MIDDQYPDAYKKILASIQYPLIGEAGKTGLWRSLRPVLNVEKCIVVRENKHNCHICWISCPEGTISRTIPPVINYEYCKGCGICAHECPYNAIELKREKEFRSCQI